MKQNNAAKIIVIIAISIFAFAIISTAMVKTTNYYFKNYPTSNVSKVPYTASFFVSQIFNSYTESVTNFTSNAAIAKQTADNHTLMIILLLGLAILAVCSYAIYTKKYSLQIIFIASLILSQYFASEIIFFLRYKTSGTSLFFVDSGVTIILFLILWAPILSKICKKISAQHSEFARDIITSVPPIIMIITITVLVALLLPNLGFVNTTSSLTLGSLSLIASKWSHYLGSVCFLGIFTIMAYYFKYIHISYKRMGSQSKRKWARGDCTSQCMLGKS